MALDNFIVSDLIKLAEAGAGLKINVEGRLTSDLIKLAQATKKGGGVLVLQGAGSKIVSDLVRIGQAGRGHVVLEDLPSGT